MSSVYWQWPVNFLWDPVLIVGSDLFLHITLTSGKGRSLGRERIQYGLGKPMRLDRWDVPSCTMFCNESNYEQVLTAGQGHENHLVAAFSSSESWPYSKGIHEDRSQESECTVKSSHRGAQQRCDPVLLGTLYAVLAFHCWFSIPSARTAVRCASTGYLNSYFWEQKLQKKLMEALPEGHCRMHPYPHWEMGIVLHYCHGQYNCSSKLDFHNCLVYSKLCCFHWPCLVPVWPLIHLWAVKHNYLLMETILFPLGTSPASGMIPTALCSLL